MKFRALAITTLIIVACLFYSACSDDKAKVEKPVDGLEVTNDKTETHGSEIKPGDVTLTTPLNKEWITAGKNIYDLKCQGCHKLSDERIVGPGWAGITKRREPHWVMNMITNVDMMLETDAEAQKLLEQCLVRMPNLSISKDESRQILEFMRSNDGAK